jgi:predicted nucleic acid-binding protein
MKVKIMLEHTDTIKTKDEYIISDDQVIKERKQTLKRKLSDDDIEHLDDYQNELNIIKKNKTIVNNA